MDLNFRTLRASEIDLRVATISDKGLRLLLYKDARVDMTLLDEVAGPMNWKRSHSRDNANCVVSIYDPDKREWVGKEDVGTESNSEAQKGLASDSFKRACVNWGIGRELYTAPLVWIPAGNYKIEERRNGRTECADKFDVREIGYNQSREINRLAIANRRTGAVVYTYGTPGPIICADCGTEITEYRADNGRVYTAEQVAARAQKTYGRQLCCACASALKNMEG